MLRLHPSALDYAIVAVYFVVVLGIGFVARLAIKTDVDFFLSGRSLPAWITGLAFIAANLGALEILGQAANGAQYGVAAVHYYWIGAVPAMIFLGLVMMPFYYGAKVRSVPEYLRLRFGEWAARLQRGHLRRGHRADQRRQPVRAGADHPPHARVVGDHGDPRRRRARARLHHARRPHLGHLQRGPAVLHHRRRRCCRSRSSPCTPSAASTGSSTRSRRPSSGSAGLHAWQGLAIHHVTNPLQSDWVGVVFGLGFVLSFGYWTTNFAEVQRALSAKNMSAARRTPLIGAFPKILLPGIIILPGPDRRRHRVAGLGGKSVEHAVQHRHPAPDRQLPARGHARTGDHRDAGRLHGRRGRQRDLVQHRGHLRPRAGLLRQGPRPGVLPALGADHHGRRNSRFRSSRRSSPRATRT